VSVSFFDIRDLALHPKHFYATLFLCETRFCVHIYFLYHICGNFPDIFYLEGSTVSRHDSRVNETNTDQQKKGQYAYDKWLTDNGRACACLEKFNRGAAVFHDK
jgi:hypothetical protein